MDVEHATNAFIDEAVKRAKPSMTAGQLVQAIQGSAYPDGYDAAEPTARVIIDMLGGF